MSMRSPARWILSARSLDTVVVQARYQRETTRTSARTAAVVDGHTVLPWHLGPLDAPRRLVTSCVQRF